MWIVALFPAGFLWLITVLLIIPTFGDARYEEPTSRKIRTLVAIPLMMGAVILLSFVLRVPQRLGASIYLAQHRGEMFRAVTGPRPQAAAAIPYLHGLPDGGLVIVQQARGRPEQLSSAEQYRLTGEQIQSCDRIIGAWLCGFD